MNTQENNKTIAQVIKTQKNNKMIAEFMKHSHPFLPSKSTINYIAEDLEYDNDWNWLMPVVEKIESIDEELKVFGGNIIKVSYSIQIENTSVTVWEHSDRFDSKRIIEISGESKRTTTYNAVIEFINQYNKNQ